MNMKTYQLDNIEIKRLLDLSVGNSNNFKSIEDVYTFLMNNANGILNKNMSFVNKGVVTKKLLDNYNIKPNEIRYIYYDLAFDPERKTIDFIFIIHVDIDKEIEFSLEDFFNMTLNTMEEAVESVSFMDIINFFSDDVLNELSDEVLINTKFSDTGSANYFFDINMEEYDFIPLKEYKQKLNKHYSYKILEESYEYEEFKEYLPVE